MKTLFIAIVLMLSISIVNAQSTEVTSLDNVRLNPDSLRMALRAIDDRNDNIVIVPRKMGRNQTTIEVNGMFCYPPIGPDGARRGSIYHITSVISLQKIDTTKNCYRVKVDLQVGSRGLRSDIKEPLTPVFPESEAFKWAMSVYVKSVVNDVLLDSNLVKTCN